MNFRYTINTATEKQILAHLKRCNDNFSPPLNERVVLHEYSNKIFEKSITFEAWEKGSLIGLVSAYFNDKENRTGFITNVSTNNKYKRRGIATKLLNMCINYAQQHNFAEIDLEVAQNNNTAIQLYEINGFYHYKNGSNCILMKYRVNEKGTYEQ
jgi:ribosomal protein S18 acetylase RimI-like enzyme